MAASVVSVPGGAVEFSNEQLADVENLAIDRRPGLIIRCSGEADAATEQAVVEQQYGGNLDRLTQIERAYDPDNLFRIDNNIVPD